MSFPSLQTERLLLLPVEAADQAFVYKGMSDKIKMPYMGHYYESFEDTATQMKWYADMYESETGIPWKIVEKGSGLPVGIFTVYYYKKEHNKAEAGYWLLPEFWGKGYATEALQAVIHYWFNEKQLHRLEAFVETENPESANVLKKCSFVYEGTMRDCEIKFNKYISLDMYALIK